MALTPDEIQRYSRQIILAEVGGTGQEKLKSGSVLLVGAGGLGSPAALYLAAAGVGRLGLVDYDTVDMTNLQRQILHFTPDVGRAKVESGAEKIAQINPAVKVETHRLRLSAENIKEIIADYDFIIDGADNFPTKFLISDACVMSGKAFSHAGILRFEGQMFTYLPNGTSGCYRCIFPAPPPAGKVPSCSQAGILGAVAGIIGTMQAAEALKYLIGQGELLTNRLLIHNAKRMTFREVKFKKSSHCPVCGENPSITTLTDEAQAVCDLQQ